MNQFCNLGAGVTNYSNLNEVLSLRSESHRDKIAFAFLHNGEQIEATLDYETLHRKAGAIGYCLSQQCNIGSRVLLLYPPGLDFVPAIFGCLYAGMIAVPASLSGRRTQVITRLRHIAEDAGVGAVLTVSSQLSLVETVLAEYRSKAVVICTDIPHTLVSHVECQATRPDTLALLQYTSGSTGEPKGVMVTHGNLLHNLAILTKEFQQSETSVFVSWLPVFHDQGLISNVLLTVYLGATSYMMAPSAFIQQPLRWLRAISRFRATTSGGPNFSYELCLRKAIESIDSDICLDSWRVAFNGAEPVRRATLERFAERFSPHGFDPRAFTPSYGLAEATLVVTGGVNASSLSTKELFERDALERGEVRITDNPERALSLVSAGRILGDQNIEIVDPQSLRMLPENYIGEVWLEGASVAQGYWGRPELSRETFENTLGHARSARFLRTGDLGFKRNGQLFITGRLKDLIIIRGRNLYPNDIEATVEQAHPALQSGAGCAFSVDTGFEEEIILIYEVPRIHMRALDIKSIADVLCIKIAEQHEAQLHGLVLLRPGSLPKTTSNKVQRNLCRQTYCSGGFDVLAEWYRDGAEALGQKVQTISEGMSDIHNVMDVERLATLVAAHSKVSVDEVMRVDSLVELGMDSLGRLQLAHAIERDIGRYVSIEKLFEELSCEELAESINTSSESVIDSVLLESANDQPVFDVDVSYGQRGLWSIYKHGEDLGAYNIAYAAVICSPVQLKYMNLALRQLLRRHAVLRTTIEEKLGQPLRQVHMDSTMDFRVIDAGLLPLDNLRIELSRHAYRPFDLAHEYPIRACLVRTKNLETILSLTVHHICSDAWSMAVIMRDIARIYSALCRGDALDPEYLHDGYADFIGWQKRFLQSAIGTQQESLWLKHLNGAPPLLRLPVARPSLMAPSRAGAHVYRTLNTQTVDTIDAYSRRHRTTTATVLLAAFQALLYRHTGVDDIVIGMPVAGRTNAKFSEIVGYFANTVIIRTPVRGQESFEQHLHKTHASVSKALAAQTYPFELLASRLRIGRTQGHSPVFQIMYVFEQGPQGFGDDIMAFAAGAEASEISLGDLTMRPLKLNRNVAQFDITLFVTPHAGQLHIELEYLVDVYDSYSMHALADSYVCLLQSAMRAPEQRIGELAMVDANAHNQNSTQICGAVKAYTHNTVFSRIAHQMIETPDATALSGESIIARTCMTLSYSALRRCVEKVAFSLQSDYEVGVGSVVALCCTRSVEMIIAILGIMRTGAAYLPMTPKGPPERQRMMLSESKARLIISEASLANFQCHELGSELNVVAVDIECLMSGYQDVPQIEPQLLAYSPVYIMYTSGSTGRPKGVVITHAGLANRINWMEEYCAVTAEDVVLQKTVYTFDVSGWEIFLPMCVGAKLILAGPGVERDPCHLERLIYRERISLMHFVPAMLGAFLDSLNSSQSLVTLRGCVCSGEALTSGHVRKFIERTCGNVALWNYYGPTETSIDITAHRIESVEERPPIGCVVPNSYLYIMGPGFELLPQGFVGELCIGGVQLAQGYLNRPDLTAGSFIPDPEKYGERLYRTGDLVRCLPDGTLEWLGRIDEQVKLRGYRIELGEIEAKLQEYPSVCDAVVTSFKLSESRELLVAYLVTDNTDNNPDAVKAYLSRHLPVYMIPTSYVYLHELPKTASGKVARSQLPEPVWDTSKETTLSYPSNDIEKRLVSIWSKVLHVPECGVHDNYYSLGGDSIQSIRIAALARAQGIEIGIQDFLHHQTVAEMAKALAQEHRRKQVSCINAFQMISSNDRASIPSNVEDAYPLSMLQRGIVFHAESNRDYEIYVTSIRIAGVIRPHLFQRALDHVITVHPFLRSYIDLVNFSEPMQIIRRKISTPIRIVDLTRISSTYQDKELQQWKEREKSRRFNWSVAPLLRVTIHRLASKIFQISLSEAALDGWCVATILTDLFVSYDALQQGRQSPVKMPSASYREFVAEERKVLATPEHATFWAKQLLSAGAGKIGRWPCATSQKSSRRRQILEIPNNIQDSLNNIAHELNLPLRSILLGVHAGVTQFLLGSIDVLTGLEINGRLDIEDGDKVIGVFNNIVPLRIIMAGGSWVDLIRQVFDAERTLYPHRRYPLAKLQKKFGNRSLFDSVFVFTHFHILREMHDLDGYEVLEEYASDQTYVPLTAHFNVNAINSRLRLLLDYNSSEFGDAQVAAIRGYYLRALYAVTADITARYDRCDYISDSDHRALKCLRSHTQGESISWEPLYRIIAARASKNPDAIAVVGELHLSYSALIHRSNIIANKLYSLGVMPDSRIAIIADRCPELLIAILATWRVGAAYVPIDPAYPSDRIRFLIQDSHAQVILHKTRVSVPSGLENIKSIDLSTDTQGFQSYELDEVNPSWLSLPYSVAYIMYTSGSSGVPKGVIVTHKGLSNYVGWSMEAYSLIQGSGAPCHSSIAFDLTVTSLFTPLVAGRTVYCVQQEPSAEALVARLYRDPMYSLIKLTPPHIKVLASLAKGRPLSNGPITLVLGGQALYAQDVAQLRELFPAARIVNEYGPTETVVGCSAYIVDTPVEDAGRIPIGRPINNADIYVFNLFMQPVPPGTVGELYIGGDCLCQGYQNCPELTAERLLPDPNGVGARLYKTGDLAVVTPTGDLIYIGRRDRQCKIDGYRVELPEVEAAILEYPAIGACAVVTREVEGVERLVAYLVARNTAIDIAALRVFLLHRLPRFMQPAFFIALPDLPQNENGKTALEKLPAPLSKREYLQRITAALETVEAMNEIQLAEMLAESKVTV